MTDRPHAVEDNAASPGEVLRFRKRPVVVEAVLWDGHMLSHTPEWIGAALNAAPGTPGWIYRRWDLDEVRIVTLEGEMIASPGDWIIRGVQGELYPCKPDIFAMTYEPATPAPAKADAGAGWVDLGPAWTNIETAEPEFLETLAERGGLHPQTAALLRHCARLLRAAPASELIDRFKLAARTIIRDRSDANVRPPLYAEDVQTLADVLHVLEATAALQSSAPAREGDARDAARWRWVTSVRDKSCEPIQSMWNNVTTAGREFPTKDEWDAAIDAAMAAAPEGLTDA